MTIPAWLANLEMELALAQQGERDYVFELCILANYTRAMHGWLAVTRVQGDRDARRIWARTCRVFWGYADFRQLRPVARDAGSGLDVLVTTALRLDGLRRV